MMIRRFAASAALIWFLLLSSCAGPGDEVRLMTLDPGHFHAALVQKTMYDTVSPAVHVYAPEGPDVMDHLKRIRGFNTRSENPTAWEETVYTGDDFLEKMLREKPGSVVVISGNNKKKAEYIMACVRAGLNVLADKPMCIDRRGYELLIEAFAEAEKNGVLLYDVMTERSEITTILQKRLVHDKGVFGELLEGTPKEPSVVKESVHHFFKYVAGKPNKRPPWFFDTTQQGEGIVDVTTHLVDLVLWECFPGESVDRIQVEIKGARRWPTLISKDQFGKATQLDDFPGYLKESLNAEGELPCFANGEILFKVNGHLARVAVRWNFEAPKGGGDTHFSVMRGTRANVIIRQGKEQGYKPELYVEAVEGSNRTALAVALDESIRTLQEEFPGLGIRSVGEGWRVEIPDRYRIGHEVHFRQVMERYLDFLEERRLPLWEVPNMLTKYDVTTRALEKATGGIDAPEGAKVLFDGTDFSKWTNVDGGEVRWSLDEGAMKVKPGKGSIMTREKFKDFRLHMEFRIPDRRPSSGDDSRGSRGNSGVYLQRRYEVQILDSFGVELTEWDCGALYRIKAPDKNLCKPPGEWQAFDILFRAARFEKEGERWKKIEDARITVYQNGALIHDDVKFPGKTGLGLEEGPEPGPILLQDHGSEVAFRNIWIVPSKERNDAIPQ